MTVDYGALLKLAEHLTPKQKMAAAGLHQFLGFLCFKDDLSHADIRAILEATLDTQAALEGMLPEEEK